MSAYSDFRESLFFALLRDKMGENRLFAATSAFMPGDLSEFSSETIDRLVRSTMPLEYILWDISGNGIDCSAGVPQFFGLQTPQEVFNHWTLLSPPIQPSGHSSEKFFRDIATLTNANGQIVFEWQHQTIDGKPLSVEVTCIRHSFHGRDFVITYLRDLRGPEQNTHELDTDHHRLMSIIRSCPICFAILLDDRFTFVTPFLSNFLGVKTGDTFTSLVVTPELPEEWHRETDDNGFVSWVPVTIRTPSGDIKEMLANFIYFDEGAGGTERIVWLVDVTQSRRLESELITAKEHAEAASKTKSEFLANMSHEIRTPMNAIIGLTHLALLTPLTKQQTEYIETAQRSAQMLLQLINDILDFSKIEAGRMNMEYREFSIGSVISDVTATVSVLLQKKQLEFQVEVDENIPLTVMGDSVRLHQVILNLLTNAIKFTNTGSVRLNIESVEMDVLSIIIRFSVTDTGIGMTPIQIKGLFQPFSQASTATTRLFGGTGLGLAISKRLVEAMHGKISCQSEPGKGTTFTFTAQFGIPLEGDRITIEESSEIQVSALLVGDSPSEQATMRHYIELLRSKVYQVGAEPEEFKKILDTEQIRQIDFIVFDFLDLRKDFIPLYTMLREKRLEPMPLCVVTKHAELEAVFDELDIKDSIHILKKPVIASDLFNVITMTTDHKKKMLYEKKASDSQIAAAGKQAVHIPDSIRGAKILLAEDNKINQMVATELLKHKGFEAVVADNGRIVLELLQEHKFDLILMDVQMPEMDGFETTRIIRADPRFSSIPILAMTANAMAGDRDVCLKAGMNDHIAKPIEPNILYRLLVKWLQK